MIKKELLTGTTKVVVGEKYNDLVLRTLGKVYILTGSKLTLLLNLLETINKADENNVIFTDSLNDLKYPGEGIFVFDITNKILYLSYAEKYISILQANNSGADLNELDKRYINKDGDVMQGSLEINNGVLTITQNNLPPLNITSNRLVKNLNVLYLNGLSYDKYAQIDKDETIQGSWKFNKKISFLKDALFFGNLESNRGYQPGLNGFGWRLDSNTNTLEIDNLVVRKVFKVFEFVISKISATNGSLWISSSQEIDTVELIDPELAFDKDFFFFESGILDNEPKILTYKLKEAPTDDNAFNPDNYDIIYINLYSDFFKDGECYKATLRSGDYPTLRLFDIIRCQKVSPIGIQYYDAIITLVYPEYYVFQVSPIYNNLYEVNVDGTKELISRSTNSEGLSIPKNGDHLIKIGNLLDNIRQGSIFLNADEANSPSIDILQDVNRPNWEVPIMTNPGVYSTALSVRLGNLNNLHDPSFGINQPKGSGLYCKNIFIKGRFVLVEEDGSESELSTFRGDWHPDGTYYLNNLVLYEQNMYICLVIKLAPSITTPPEAGNNIWKLIIPKGLDAPEVKIRYSIDGETWVDSINPDCIFAQFSTDGGKSWSETFRIVGEDGTPGPYMNFKFKSALSTENFDPWDGSQLDETWLDAPGNVSEGYSNYMTTRLYLGDTPVTQTTWSYPIKISGDKGDDGEDGPSLLYYGEYSPSEIYTIQHSLRIIVSKTISNNKTFFQTKLPKEGAPIGSFSGIDPETNTTYWKPFNSNFKSIATEVLFAEYANIGGLIFKNENLISQSGKINKVDSTDFTNPEFIPNLIIDGKTGTIDMIKGTFGKLLNGAGFYVEGNNIIGKAVVNDFTVDRILITTEALPDLQDLINQEGTSSEDLRIIGNLPIAVDTSPYSPQGLDVYNNLQDKVILTCKSANFQRGDILQNEIFTKSFTIAESPSGLTRRVLKFTASGIGHNTTSYNNKILGEYWNNLTLEKLEEGGWKQYPIIQNGINVMEVLAGSTYRFKLYSKCEYTSYIFNLVGDIPSDITGDLELGDLTSGHNVELYKGAWPYSIEPSPNPPIPDKYYFQAQYLNDKLLFPDLKVLNLKVFDGISRTIIANDGFCSYWSPENYFYFQKDIGLKQSVIVSDVAKTSTYLDLETRILAIENTLGLLS